MERLFKTPLCKCSRGTCFSQFAGLKDKEELLKFLQCFWSFSKTQQDALDGTSVGLKKSRVNRNNGGCVMENSFEPTKLHNVVGHQRDGSSSSWKLLRKICSKICVAALLGVGKARLRLAKSGFLDRRYAKFGGVPCLNPFLHDASSSFNFLQKQLNMFV